MRPLPTTALVLPLAVAALLSGSLLHAQTSADRLHRLFADYWEDRLRLEPELATRTGRTEYNDRWRDWSPAGLERAHASRVRFRSELDQFDPDGLSSADRLSLTLLRGDLDRRLENEALDAYLLTFGQLAGPQNDVYTTIAAMSARTTAEYEQQLARIGAVPTYVDQYIQLMQAAIARGIVQPKVVVELVLEQVDQQLRQPARETPLLAAFRAFPPAMPAADRVALAMKADAVYADRFLPAWRTLRTFVAGTYAPRARAGISLSTIPDGAAAYARLVRRFTTTSIAPEVIHQRGLDEVRRIEGELQQIGRGIRFDATLPELEAQLRADPDLHFDSREDMLAFCRRTLATIEGQLPKLFARVPRTTLGCRPVPQGRETVWPNFYEGPSGDGRGAFINLVTYRPQGQVRYDKETLILHEGLPGHHLQQSLQAEARDLPDFRRAYSSPAYVEGWAVYAESLGGDLGLYRDPYSRFGRLSMERYWAARLVVDTGIHALGWSRPQAEDYFLAHAGAHALEDIDQFIAWPGQALAYTIGGLTIKDLRLRAERALGPRFDVREFHDVVLRNGALPLDLVAQQVEAYIQSARAPGR